MDQREDDPVSGFTVSRETLSLSLLNQCLQNFYVTLMFSKQVQDKVSPEGMVIPTSRGRRLESKEELAAARVASLRSTRAKRDAEMKAAQKRRLGEEAEDRAVKKGKSSDGNSTQWAQSVDRLVGNRKASSKDEVTQWARREARAKYEALDPRYNHTIGMSKEARKAREKYVAALYSTDEDIDEECDFCSRDSTWTEDSTDYFTIVRNNMKD